jgi:hypothetical protein
LSTLVQKLNTITGKWEASELIEDDLPDGIGGGSQLDIAEKTLYVCSPFTTEGQFYDNIEDAITDADADGNAHTIEIWGVHSGNFDFGIHTAYLHPLAEIKPYNTAFPAIYLRGGNLLGDGIVTDGGLTTTDYLIEVTEDATIEAREIYGDYGAINLSGFSGGAGRYIEINVNKIGEINYDSVTAPVYADINAGFLNGLEINGHTEATFNITVKEFLGKANLRNGRVYLDVQNYLTEDTRLLEVAGAKVVAKGRLEDFDEASSNTTGVGFPILMASGELRLYDFFAKNGSGGLIFGVDGLLVMGHSVLESGSVGGGGGDYTIDAAAAGPFNVIFNTRCSLNYTVNPIITQVTAGNRIVNTAIVI